MRFSESVLDRFRRNALDRPRQELYVFVDDKGRDQQTLTHAQFSEQIDRLAEFLIDDLGLSPGDRALLVYPPSLDFVIAFVGCMAAGLVPVPIAPPNPFRLESDLKAFESVAADSGSVVVLTSKSYLRAKKLAAARDLFVRRGGAWSMLPWQRTDGISGRVGSPMTPAADIPTHQLSSNTPQALPQAPKG